MKIIIFLLASIMTVATNYFPLNHKRNINSFKRQYECKTDSLFSNLINNSIDTIFLFLNLNINIEESGLLIWKKFGSIEGIKFKTDSKGCFVFEQTTLIYFKEEMNDIVNNYFVEDKIDELERNPFETMHDYPIIIHSYNNGSLRNHKFWRSDVSEKGKSMLDRASTICLKILNQKR